MAIDASAVARVHRALKARVRDGGFALGERLDVNRIAAEMSVSTTPVREALSRLAMERLIELKPTQGYYLSLWSEERLAALYRWRGALLTLALEERAGEMAEVEPSLDLPNRVGVLFAALSVGVNIEVALAAANADDRLHIARRSEAEIWSDADEEFARLSGSLGTVALTKRRKLVRDYHARRANAARLIRERTIVRLTPNGQRQGS